jgi:hypothetical protein
MLATACGATAMAGRVSGPHVFPANERVTDGARTRALRSHNPPIPVSEGCSCCANRLSRPILLLVVARGFCLHPLGEHIKERQAGAPEVIWATSQEVLDHSPPSEP